MRTRTRVRDAKRQSAPPAGPDLLPPEEAARDDRYLRLAADFENYRKRTRRDSAQQAAAEKEAFIHELIPALDSLERALASDSAAASEPLRKGLALTLQQMGQLLRRHGIEAIAEVGQPFNPHRHEALSVRHDGSQADQTILEVVQSGYTRDGRVFRPARVIVNDLGPAPGAAHAG